METIIKQNNKKIIQCDRCGGTFCKLDNLRRHLKKKKICEPILKDIPVAELIEKYKVRKGCYKCENCGKEYKHRSGLSRHKKKCFILNKKSVGEVAITIAPRGLPSKPISAGLKP